MNFVSLFSNIAEIYVVVHRQLKKSGMQARFAVAIFCFAIGNPQPAPAQIKVDVAQGATYGAHCSLPEAIYGTEFKTNAALDATDPDSAYVTGCSDPSG